MFANDPLQPMAQRTTTPSRIFVFRKTGTDETLVLGSARYVGSGHAYGRSGNTRLWVEHGHAWPTNHSILPTSNLDFPLGEKEETQP